MNYNKISMQRFFELLTTNWRDKLQILLHHATKDRKNQNEELFTLDEFGREVVHLLKD